MGSLLSIVLFLFMRVNIIFDHLDYEVLMQCSQDKKLKKMDGTDRLFSIGSIFNSSDEVKEHLTRYNSTNSCQFVVTTNNKKSLLIKCSHGIARKTHSKGARPHQHVNFIGCEASINLYKNKNDGTMKVTKSNLLHNHEKKTVVSASLSLEEEEMVINLRNANAKTSQIKRILHEKYQKTFTTQKLLNVIRKLVQPGVHNQDSFESFLLHIEEEGGKIEYSSDDAGEVSTFFLASKTMIQSFIMSNPPLIHVDLSFDVDKARYKIAAFCYLNPTTNRSEIAAIAYTADETAVSLDCLFRNFRSMCDDAKKIFIVDKDFTQIGMIEKNFPGCTVILCQFHTLKYMRNLIATAVTVVETKTKLFEQFKRIVYAHNEEAFESESKKFIEESSEIMIRINKTYQLLPNYYLKNWESCKKMWVKCFRKHLPILGDNTTNRVERTFWMLKESLQATFRGLPDTATSIMHVVKLADQRLKERYDYTANKSLRIIDSDERIQNLNDDASLYLNDRGCTIFHAAQKMLEKHRERLDVVQSGVVHVYDSNQTKLYATTNYSCDCSFHKTHQSPCMHIIYRREQNNEGFTKELFNSRYFRMSERPSIEFPSSDHMELIDNETNDNASNVIESIEEDLEYTLDAREKHKMVTPVLLRIGNVISAHSTRKCLQYLGELECIERRIRQGLPMIENFNEANTNQQQSNQTVEVRETPVIYQQEITSATTNADPVASGSISTDNFTSSSRFSNLAFKKGVTTKGRPKKRGKQISFRKTQADSTQVASKKKKATSTATITSATGTATVNETETMKSNTFPKKKKNHEFRQLLKEVSNSPPLSLPILEANNTDEIRQFSFLRHLNDETFL